MAIFYLQVDDQIWEMDSTSSVTESRRGSLSSSRVEDGGVSSDNYVTDPVEINFSGVITDIKSLSVEGDQPRSTRDYLAQLKQVWLNKTPIRVSHNAESPLLDNCYFTSFSSSQNPRNGVNTSSGTPLSSFKVSFSLQQVRTAKRAVEVSAPSKELTDALSPEQERDASVVDSCGGAGVDRELCELEIKAELLKAGV